MANPCQCPTQQYDLRPLNSRYKGMTKAGSMDQESLHGLFEWITWVFKSIPGRDIFLRYIASSYQNDPIRSLLELILFIFAVRTILQNRTRARGTSHFIQFSEDVSTCGELTR